MKGFRAPLFILGCLYVCFIVCLVSAESHLPLRVATHFNGNGEPNGWMLRSTYLEFMVVFGLAFPLLVPGLMWLSRFIPVTMQNIPNREYWFSPSRRSDTFSYLFRHSLWFASMSLCFVIGMHVASVQANSTGQAHLSNSLVLTFAGVFLASTVFWTVSMLRHFNRVVSPAF